MATGREKERVKNDWMWFFRAFVLWICYYGWAKNIMMKI